MTRERPPLSPLEHEVMAIVWARGSTTAAEVVAGLGERLSNPTVRTLLRRLEAKGYVRHAVRGRTFVYQPKVAATQAAVGAVRRVIDRFFGGSGERLITGMIDDGLIDEDELRELSRRLARARRRRRADA